MNQLEGASKNQPPLRSAKPSRLAQVMAFLAICVAGAGGGIIGYAYQDIQCDSNCGIRLGLYALGGAVVASVGVAIIVVLVLRAMEEWQGANSASNSSRAKRKS